MSELHRFYCADGWRWYALSEIDYNAGKCFAGVTSTMICHVAPRLQNKMKRESAAKQERNLKLTGDDGTNIHECILEWDLRGKNYKDCPLYKDKYEGAIQNWLVLKKKHDIKPILIEQRVWHNDYGFAGTLDLYGYFDGRRCLMDLKTGYYGPKAGWQMAAYTKAFEQRFPDQPVEGMVGIQVHRDGVIKNTFEYSYKAQGFDPKVPDGEKWEYVDVDDAWINYLACLNNWRTQCKPKLKNMGWFFIDKQLLKAA